MAMRSYRLAERLANLMQGGYVDLEDAAARHAIVALARALPCPQCPARVRRAAFLHAATPRSTLVLAHRACARPPQAKGWSLEETAEFAAAICSSLEPASKAFCASVLGAFQARASRAPS